MTTGGLPENPTLQERTGYLIQELTGLKNRRFDIPEQLFHSFSASSGNSGYPDYKVRKGRFAGIVSLYGNVSNQILRDKKYDELREELKNDIMFFCNDDFRRRITTKEDIAKGDAVIDKMLKILKEMK